MPFDDFFRVSQSPDAVPHSIGINHNAWPILTGVQTACCFSPNLPFQTQSSNFLFEKLSNDFGALLATTSLGMTLRTLVHTNKNVVLIGWHISVVTSIP